jgi:hypothetical protein
LKAKQTVFSLIYRLKSEPVTKVEDEKYYWINEWTRH